MSEEFGETGRKSLCGDCKKSGGVNQNGNEKSLREPEAGIALTEFCCEKSTLSEAWSTGYREAKGEAGGQLGKHCSGLGERRWGLRPVCGNADGDK